jgi:hypothetical protein
MCVCVCVRPGSGSAVRRAGPAGRSLHLPRLQGRHCQETIAGQPHRLLIIEV